MAASCRGIIGERPNSPWPKIMVLCVGHGTTLVRAYRCFNGCTTCTFFHCKVHTADNSEAHAQIQDTNKKHDKKRSDDSKFDCRRAALVVGDIFVKFAHVNSTASFRFSRLAL